VRIFKREAVEERALLIPDIAEEIKAPTIGGSDKVRFSFFITFYY
jgi:hypothetical protein